MAKAYSRDLRERIANAEGSIRKIAARFDVSKTVVQKYKAQQKEKGHLETQYPRVSHRRLLDDEKMSALKEYILANPGIIQAQMREFIMEKYGIKISRSGMCKYVKELGITLKKNNLETRKYTQKK